MAGQEAWYIFSLDVQSRVLSCYLVRNVADGLSVTHVVGATFKAQKSIDAGSEGPRARVRQETTLAILAGCPCPLVIVFVTWSTCGSQQVGSIVI